MILKKIISGGQTGADQGALDGAIWSDFPYGGSIPAGRKTETGPLHARYQMEELDSESYPERTAKNVKNSDGTLIVSHGTLTGGSALTSRFAEESGKPCLHVDFSLHTAENGTALVLGWLIDNKIEVLNVAGPRASSDTKIYEMTRALVIALIRAVMDGYE